jgi:hypothetical protein
MRSVFVGAVLQLSLAVVSSIVFAQEVSTIQESVRNPDLESKNIGVGLSLGSAFRGLGLQAYYQIKPSWMLELEGYTSSLNGFNSGENPSASLPYGYEITDYKRSSLSVVLQKTFPMNKSETFSWLFGAGLGASQTSSKANFYNAINGGLFNGMYDRNSPAGSDTFSKTSLILPVQVGMRVTASTKYAYPFITDLILELPLSNDDTPSYQAPNGQTTTPSKWYTEGQFKVDVGVLF